MRNQTAAAKGMTDKQLEAKELALRRSIPADQSLLDAIKRERRSRKRKTFKPAPAWLDIPASTEAGAP